MSRTLLARIGYVLAKGAVDRLREKMDVRKTNGGVFLGLNGLVVKSHGGTDAEGFAAAVELAYDMARRDLLGRIRRDLEHFHGRRPEIAAPEPMNEATGAAHHAG
jgi:glycerol-3-phosphate acyltransferase PlsX